MKTKIDFGWGKEEERLKMHLRLSPRKRLEWLCQIQMSMRQSLTKKKKKVFWQLRQANSWGQGDL